jgi:hypothetical protein
VKSQKRGAERSKTATELEMLTRKQAAADILRTGAPTRYVIAALQKNHGITYNQANNAIKSVKQDLVTEYEASRSTARAEVTFRLRASLANAYSRQAKCTEESEKVAWAKVALDIEAHLARVEGTTVPIRLEVQAKPVAASIAEYLASLTEDDIEELYEVGQKAFSQLNGGATAQLNGSGTGQTH